MHIAVLLRHFVRHCHAPFTFMLLYFVVRSFLGSRIEPNHLSQHGQIDGTRVGRLPSICRNLSLFLEVVSRKKNRNKTKSHQLINFSHACLRQYRNWRILLSKNKKSNCQILKRKSKHVIETLSTYRAQHLKLLFVTKSDAPQ